MWFLLLLVPAAFSAVGSLFTLTGGANVVIVAAAANEWQRRKGYKAGEGQFTPRANGEFYGVGIDKGIDYGLCIDLAAIAEKAPALFENLLNRRFDLTVTEAGLLRDLVAPVVPKLEALMEVSNLQVPEEQREEFMTLLTAAADDFIAAARPVARWLEEFPGSRVKKVA